MAQLLSHATMMQALKKADVEFIVAPFEADAQMAYLAINGLVHAVITEDSDLLPYGCPRVSCRSTTGIIASKPHKQAARCAEMLLYPNSCVNSTAHHWHAEGVHAL